LALKKQTRQEDGEKIATQEVHINDWVKWPERKSDHKPLYNVEIMSGATILSIYMSVLTI
jgi:hypothetical protein